MMIRFGRKLAGLALVAGFLLAPEPLLRADEILDWNATIRDIEAMRTDAFFANPGYSTRSMAMANGAMFDVMMSFDKQYNPYLFNGTAPTGASQTAAMAQASYVILNNLYGSAYAGAANPVTDASQASAIGVRLQNDVTTKLNSVADVNARNAGIALGNQVAAQYLAARANDGITTPVQYVPDPGQTPGHWQPDPYWPATHGGNNQQAWGPNWGNVTPFILTNNNQFTVAAPPALDSLEYKISYDQVKDYGSVNSSVRTQDQTNIGIFWAYDRPTMGPPPILYTKNLEEISKVMGNSQVENARLFTLVSLGMADAGVASWDAKYNYDYWRPVTAIQNGATDGNILTDGDVNWRPLGAQGNDPNAITDDFTPPFPAYPSGHATFGGVTYEILRQFYGTDLLNYTLTSNEMAAGNHSVAMSGLTAGDILALREVYGDAYVDAALNSPGQMISIDNKMRMFNSFSEAEWENAISRVYLGVHWSFDATEGIKLGNNIGDYAFANFLTAVPEPSTYALFGTALVAAGWYRRRRRIAN
jgi:hypothetical protein